MTMPVRHHGQRAPPNQGEPQKRPWKRADAKCVRNAGLAIARLPKAPCTIARPATGPPATRPMPPWAATGPTLCAAAVVKRLPPTERGPAPAMRGPLKERPATPWPPCLATLNPPPRPIPPMWPAAAAAAAAALTTTAVAPSAVTAAAAGVRHDGHQRNGKQQHRGNGDARLQRARLLAELDQFRTESVRR